MQERAELIIKTNGKRSNVDKKERIKHQCPFNIHLQRESKKFEEKA